MSKGDSAVPASSPASPRLGSNRVPATPLPWHDCSLGWVRRVHMEPNTPHENLKRDSVYAAHAANAYPRLVEALADAINTMRVEHGLHPDYGWGDYADSLSVVLRELGEL